jgi:hypothetical protein
METSLKDRIEALIKRLPHSDSRIPHPHLDGQVPYTYHHDYLQQKVYLNASRADIAQKKCWSEEELYATALIYLLDCNSFSIASTFLLSFDNNDLETCRQAYEICQKYIERLREALAVQNKKAFVICMNDGVKAVVLDDEERAEIKKEELAKQHYEQVWLRANTNCTYDEYRQICFWHFHETKVL